MNYTDFFLKEQIEICISVFEKTEKKYDFKIRELLEILKVKSYLKDFKRLNSIFETKYQNSKTNNITNILEKLASDVVILNNIKGFNEEHLNLTLNGEYLDALKISKRPIHFEEIAITLILMNKFDAVAYAVKNHITDAERIQNIQLFTILQQHKNGNFKERNRLFSNYIYPIGEINNLWDRIHIIRGLFGFEFWQGYNGYPFPDY